MANTNTMPTTPDTDDLVSVKELAAALNVAESTAWLIVRRLELPRYRIPKRGKTTLVSLSEAKQAYNAPRPIESRA